MSLEINLYAEFLMNIRSTTVYGTIRNKNKVYTKATVTSDSDTISLTYDGQTTSIALPLGIKVKGSIGFPVSTDPADLSVRLEIIEDNKSPHHLDVGNDAPWSSSSLGSESTIACQGCQSVIVPAGEHQWKDLPRGSWAETLDQWYCHRPEVGGVSQEGYTGSTGPQLEDGVAFVDTCNFVLPTDDCQGLETDDGSVTCKECSNQLGVVDAQLKGIRLYKWSLLVQKNQSTTWEKNKIQNFICAQMLELMEDQNIRKFLVFSGKLSEAEDGIIIWVFNPDIKFSSSKVDQGCPRRAMKVLYEPISSPAKIADKMQLAVEDLPLPGMVFKELMRNLEASHNCLPEPAKKLLPAVAMENWKVALLERFDDEAALGKT